MKMRSALDRPGVILPLVLASLLFLAAMLAVALAQDSGVSKIHKSDYAELAKVPSKARSRRNPFEGDPGAIAAGKKLFEDHCAECHGQDGRGERRGPSLRVGEVQKATPGSLYFVLSNGVVRRGMPDWSKLPEPQRWQIVSFLKTLHE